MLSHCVSCEYEITEQEEEIPELIEIMFGEEVLKILHTSVHLWRSAERRYKERH